MWPNKGLREREQLVKAGQIRMWVVAGAEEEEEEEEEWAGQKARARGRKRCKNSMVVKREGSYGIAASNIPALLQPMLYFLPVLLLREEEEEEGSHKPFLVSLQ